MALEELKLPAAIAPWTVPFILYSLLPLLGTAALAFQLPAVAQSKARATLYAFGGLINGGSIVFILSFTTLSDAHFPIYLACLATLFAGLALIPNFSKIPPATAFTAPILGSHITFWSTPETSLSFIVAFGVSIAFAFAAAKKTHKFNSKLHKLPELVLLGLSVVTVYSYLYSGYSQSNWFPFLAPAFAIALKLIRLRPFHTLADLFLLPLLLDLVFFVDSGQAFATRAIVLALYGLLLASPIIWPRTERNLCFLHRFGIGRKTAHVLVAILAFVNASHMESWLQSQITLLAAAIFFFAIWRFHRHRIAFIACIAFTGSLLLSLFDQFVSHRSNSPWSWQILLIGLSLCLFALVAGSIVKLRPTRRIGSRNITLTAYLAAIASYLAAAFTFAYPPLSLDSYYTPIIAVYCLALISLGIAKRIKPFRIVALAGFLLPLGRLFFIDIQETLHRIIAFAVLAVLFTTIGYLYTRFASRIE
ncbi:hypothetical protein VDG1235_2675 [Verrucomicrobiia bacterium DG1235]|nr:hypothetical protein VDG1235_2675 [Verrucomicrobiae bacterium DG1235]